MKINVGIDLGTTYSAVATFNKAKGAVEILKNDLDKNCTPSVVCIENGIVTIGEEAKDMQAAGNLNTAAFYKSMMGEKDYTVYIDGKEYTPEELSSEYLRVLKKNVEDANNIEIGGAVITVPAYFNEAQRTATMRAGKKAGLDVLKIINEPTSAIIAYGLTGSGRKNVMVYDLGGGTFDVTIAEVDGAKVKVISTNGNHQLGGKDWDLTLVEEMGRRFLDEYGVNIEDYPEEYKELQVKCEDVKKKLTNLSTTSVTVQCEGYSGRYEVSREFFDEQTANLLNETIILVNKSFEEIGNGFGWHSLDEVVLVGGSTRMPQVKEMIIREYGKPPITKNIDVDTIVAAGAAMQAQLCTENMLVLGGTSAPRAGGTIGGGSSGLVIRGSDIQDITAHSLGMLALSKNETDYVNSIIIEKNSKMNEQFGRQYQFSGDKLDVYVLQGESKSPYDCTLLYKYVISGMPSRQKNSFTVNFLYNSNGIVEVNAELDNGTSLAAKQCDVTESLSEIIMRLVREREEAKKAVKDVEIMFVIDTSGSMSGDRIVKAKQAMNDFMADIDFAHTRVAILDFAESCLWACPFTSKGNDVKNAISRLDIDGHCGFGTSATPLTDHGNDFKLRDSVKVIIVLTDGEWCSTDQEIAAASSLKNAGIVIYAIGIGDANESFLGQIASNKGAKKIDLSKLSSTFKEIASSIATEIS